MFSVLLLINKSSFFMGTEKLLEYVEEWFGFGFLKAEYFVLGLFYLVTTNESLYRLKIMLDLTL